MNITNYMSLSDNISQEQLDYLVKNEQLSEEFIKRFADRVNWDHVVMYQQKLSKRFINNYANRIDWKYISAAGNLSEAFIKKHADRVNWKNISREQKLSKPFIRKFAHKVNWREISIFQKLSEDFIREFANKVNWDAISCSQKLSEPFITEFTDKVNWYWISQFQVLTEPFIENNEEKWNWTIISKNQKLSKKFRSKHKKKLDGDETFKICIVNPLTGELENPESWKNSENPTSAELVEIIFYGEPVKILMSKNIFKDYKGQILKVNDYDAVKFAHEFKPNSIYPNKGHSKNSFVLPSLKELWNISDIRTEISKTIKIIGGDPPDWDFFAEWYESQFLIEEKTP